MAVVQNNIAIIEMVNCKDRLFMSLLVHLLNITAGIPSGLILERAARQKIAG
jgi:hypothetical protein